MALPRAWGTLPGQPKAPANQGIDTYYKRHPQKPKTPKPPGAPGGTGTPTVKPLDPGSQASQNAMSAFRTALAQLNQSTPPVDSAAIYAPYRASEQITGQLGQGYQQHVLDSGAAAQQQYGNALGQAQQQAAQFGISAGAGANPTQLQNTGAQPLAQQTNAYAAAAPAAAAQWQALLERTAGAKVADAQATRDQGLTNARQSLATALPGAIQNEEQLGFQKQTQRQNIGLALTQLDAKQRQFAQQYGLDALKIAQDAGQFKTTTDIKNRGLAEKTGKDAATIKIQQDTLALKKRAASVQKSGLQGVAAAVKALTDSSTQSKSGKQTTITGYNVGIVPGPNSVDAGANPRTIYAKDPAKVAIPAGWVRSGDPKPVTGTKTTMTGALGVTRAAWDAQMRSLLAQNQGVPNAAAQIKRLLGPRPKK